MANPNPPNEKDGTRSEHDRDRDDDRREGNRRTGGGGPNNPLPGEPGGPTAGFSEEDRKAAEEGQRRDRDAPRRDDQSKR
jgi:hypothetical protein